MWYLLDFILDYLLGLWLWIWSWYWQEKWVVIYDYFFMKMYLGLLKSIESCKYFRLFLNTNSKSWFYIAMLVSKKKYYYLGIKISFFKALCTFCCLSFISFYLLNNQRTDPSPCDFNSHCPMHSITFQFIFNSRRWSVKTSKIKNLNRVGPI